MASYHFSYIILVFLFLSCVVSRNQVKNTLVLSLWRNFPLEVECRQYHKPCHYQADCNKCRAEKLVCTRSKKPDAYGRRQAICKKSHGDDPQKRFISEPRSAYLHHFRLFMQLKVQTQRHRKIAYKIFS